MAAASTEVLELCSALQASVQQSIGAGGEPSAQLLSRVQTVARQLAAAARQPAAWRSHRRQILEAVVRALTEPYCFPTIVESLRWYVFPAVLILLGRLRSEGPRDPELFERSVYVLSHLICDPCLTEPILDCLRAGPPVFYCVVGLSDHSERSVRRCRLVCESVLRLTAYVTCLRKSWDWQRFHVLLHHKDEQVRRMAGVAWGHLVGLGAVKPDAAAISMSHSSLRLSTPVVPSGAWSAADEGVDVSAEQPGAEKLASDTERGRSQSWEEEGVRARHGICFKVVDASISERIPFVPIAPATESMHSLLLAIAISKPVLVTGASGVGKTSFLRRAADLMGQQEPVFLFCDEQTDIKMLLGTYVCGKTVGEFVWQPGLITESLSQGRWLVLEDVDHVPAEVLAALLPLADSRQLVLPDHNRRIDAHPNFQLFGTLSTGSTPLRFRRGEEPKAAGDGEAAMAVDSPGAEDDSFLFAESRSRVPPLVASWTQVRLSTLHESHMSQIVNGLHPDLEPLCDRLLASASALRSAAATTGAALAMGSVSVGPRELLRWCAHLKHCRLVFEPTFTEEQRTLVLREALMVFLGRVPDLQHRRSLLTHLTPVWNLASGVADALLQEQPGVTVGETEVVIGTVTLARKPPEGIEAKGGGPRGTPFAYTSVHARVLHALAAAIRSDEPALLVGDTGTGKTSVVQHIGQLLGKEVMVYNFNEQSESTELIGGFRPLDVVMHQMSELMSSFAEAFEQTFSRRKNAKLLERARGDFVARRWQSLLQVIGGIVDKASQSLSDPVAQSSKGCKATRLAVDWEQVQRLHKACSALLAHGAAPRFEFIEGLLVRALRTGAWVVLDEINLAPSDILQRIQGLIERSPGMQLALPESGDGHITPHADFRIFACMNPPRLPMPPADSFSSSAESGSGAASKAPAAEEKDTGRPGIRVGHSAGKKELPSGIRARFTEIFVDEVHTADDIGRVVRSYLENALPSPPVAAIVGFYAQAMSSCRQCLLLDGSGNVCYFSLRNLTRALRFALRLVHRPRHVSPGKEALAQGLAVGFATTLDSSSRAAIEKLIEGAVGVSPVARRSNAKVAAGAAQMTAEVQVDPDKAWLNVEGYWIRAGPIELDVTAAHKDFVITPSVRQHLQNIARMLSGGRFPILLEGPTSAGKTSLVRFLAHLTGHEFVRINNHEHTDLQEYIGQYVCDPTTGQLVFQEGVLVRAARAGHWVVLDELNLAPSEVLEALNRLLDDNRELYIPDTGVTVKPHEEFMIFATQNPAGGLYGGRKQLSRAFRNRFSEIFITELPMDELAVVLHRRCELPASFVKEMLNVYKDLQSHRSQSAVFLGRQSFMTVRDLLRWGHRKPGSHYELATEGFVLLAERLRKEEDREVVRRSLQKHCSGVKELRLDYTEDAVVKDIQQRIAARIKAGDTPPPSIGNVVWTPPFCRMCALIGRCIRADEPALLIGETGGGKTMACQVLAWALVESGDKARQLSILNCHQQTETADFIGSLRPVRGRDAVYAAACTAAGELLGKLRELPGATSDDADGSQAALPKLRSELELAAAGGGNLKTLGQALRRVLASGALTPPPPPSDPATTPPPAKKQKKGAKGAAAAGPDESKEPDAKRQRTAGSSGSPAEATAAAAPSPLEPQMKRLLGLCISWEQIFEWADGVLVEAMRAGAAFLIDEISLAEDSVLERLNSVLEPEHSLLLAEKPLTGADLEVVKAGPSFRLFATMNPGGDFGKRELSPALRNRFTEIWVESIDFRTPEAESLVANQLPWPALAKPMIRAVLWFNERVLHPLTIREVLGWSSFLRKTAPDASKDPKLGVEMYIHGGCMVLVDCLGLGNQMVSGDAPSEASGGVEHAGCLSPAQSAVLRHLVGQLDDSDFDGILGKEQRAALREAFGMGGFAWVRHHLSHCESADGLQFGNFRVLPATAAAKDLASAPQAGQAFDFTAPSTACNVGRLVRALQLPKAVLLEGPPGLGKTASVQALARATGRQLLRINLSEQTDLLDLLGADLPVAGAEVASFKWQDGAILRAMRGGDWVLLDEINLAPQATLEGLNALLDHRREVFLPAIGQTVVADPGFRLFAAQNPVAAGGGRKGLPRSFLNRFTRVVLASLSLEDLHHICQHCHKAKVSGATIDKAVDLVEALRAASAGEADGAPGGEAFEAHLDWDWNLRDALRLCNLLEAGVPLANDLSSAAQLLLVSRLRTSRDRSAATAVIRKYLPAPDSKELDCYGSAKFANSLLRDAFSHALKRSSAPTSEGEATEASSDSMAVCMPELCVGTHSVKLTAAGVQIGAATLPQKLHIEDPRCWPALEHCYNTRHLTLLSCQLPVLHVMAHAVSERLRWPVLLVGGPAAGKRSAVRRLAAAARAPLREVPLTPAMDASELLGYFEQVDAQDESLGVVRLAREAAEAMARLLLLCGKQASGQEQALNQRLAFCIKTSADLESSIDGGQPPETAVTVASVQQVLAELQQCMGALLKIGGEGKARLSALLDELCSRVAALQARTLTAGRFEWIDGPLVTALQDGSWVLLSHAEQAAPAVLDRLNSLLEPDGFLLLTESGEERLVRPHPDFRIFFTMTLGSSKNTISRALRNRCIEIFVDSADHVQESSAPKELDESGGEAAEKPTAVLPCLDFLPHVLKELGGVLSKKIGEPQSPVNGALSWARQALACMDVSRHLSASDASSPLPSALVDTSRIIAAQVPLQPSLVMHMAVLHSLANLVWVHLRSALLSPGAKRAESLAHDRSWQELFGRHLLGSSGFSWHVLRKFVALFIASTTRCSQTAADPAAKGALPGPHRSPLSWSFLQTYVPEVSGSEVETEIFSAVFEACSSLPSMPSFRWLAEAVHGRPPSLQLGPSAEAEVVRQFSPLRARIQQKAAPQDSLAALQLFLERASPADASLRAELVSQLDEPWRAWAGSVRTYLQHPMVADIVPRATECLMKQMGVLRLHGAGEFSLRDAWALADCALSEQDSGTPECRGRAVHLQGLLRCSRMLTCHTQRAPAAQSQQTAWVLSQRFQEGMVPLSSLPHPILSVAQPLICACTSGLTKTLASLPAEPAGGLSSPSALTRLCLALALAGRLQDLLESIVLEDVKAADSWALHEAKVLCLFQQLYAVLCGLDAGTSLEGVSSHFDQLRNRLAAGGMTWDPDAKRLHATLLPLTDAMNSWGGLGPPLRAQPEFLIEQLLLTVAMKQAPQAPYTPAVMSGLLAASLIRRQNGQQSTARAEEVLSKLLSADFSLDASPDATGAGGDASSSASQESNTARTHHSFLVIETVQLMWTLVGDADFDGDSFAGSIAQLASKSCQQLDKFERARCSSDGGAARCALVQALAELRVLQWVTGGEGPWSAEEGLGLAAHERLEPPRGAIHSLVERSLLATRRHLHHALALACAEEPGVAPVSLSFMLSPATLTRLRVPWQPEGAGQIAASLVIASGFKCAWSLNLCSTISSSTNMANHGWHRSLLEGLLNSCFQSDSDQSGTGDWVVLCRFLAAQFYGLQLLSEETSSWRHGTCASICALLMSLGHQLARRPSAEALSDFSEGLSSLKAFVSRSAEQLARNAPPASGCPWPMRLPALATHFIVPALDLLAKRCSAKSTAEDADAAARGELWVLASLWRLHSGGGALVPGGMDACEIAAQARAELQHRADALGAEIEARAQEELALDGRWSPHNGCAADLARERSCCDAEAADLEHFCRLRPPLAEGSVPEPLKKVPTVALVCASANGQSLPSHRELCQEMIAFSTTVVSPERILRLLAPLRGGDAQAEVNEPMVVAELQNLSASALSFVHRLQGRFPLHADLVSPVLLAVHGLLHGLHLVHRHIWMHSTTAASGISPSDLISMPQTPTHCQHIPQAILDNDSVDSCPEVACWWLQWTAISRTQQPRALTSPPPTAALEMLRALSRRHHDEEEKKAVEEVEKAAPFKLSKVAAAFEESSKQDPEGDAPTLFPGADQEEVAKFIGLEAEDGGFADMDDSGYEPGRGGGASLYDLWSKSSEPKAQKDSGAAKISVEATRELQEQQIAALCDLSLEAFTQERAESVDTASAKETTSMDSMRMEALDTSLELFVRQSVVCASQGKLATRAILLPAETSGELLPLAMLRLRRNICQLRPDRSALSTEGGVKRLASTASQERLHSQAACAFYAECSPSILLQLAVPLSALLARTHELLEEYEGHPSLLAIENCIEKIRQLRVLTTTPMAVVTMLELLLGRASVWEEAAATKVSLKAQLRPLESLLVSLRERQLLEWRDLRKVRERYWERQGAKNWLFLVGMLADAESPRALVDELMRFIRISPLGQYKLRLQMIRAASHLFLEAQGEGSTAGKVALHMFHYVSKWSPVVEKAVAEIHDRMEKEVQDLVKIVRWDLSNYHALKESVSHSHKQLSKVIRRFDDSLQGLVDTALIQGAGASDLLKMGSCMTLPSPDTAGLVVTEDVVKSLGQQREAGANRPAERIVDSEEFWSNPARVTAALPWTLEMFIKVVSKSVLPDMFCFSAPTDSTLQVAKEDLCSGAATVLEALQNEDMATPMKRRQLQGLRELCGLYGIMPKPVMKDSLDVMDFFAAALVPASRELDCSRSPSDPATATTEESGKPGEPEAAADGGEPPQKRPRLEQAGPLLSRGSDAAFEAHAATVWRRLEALTYDLVHLALRVHSIRTRPADLTAGDVNLWLGIAVACVHAVRSHRERCAAFHGALAGFSAQCGASMTERSVAVKRCHLDSLYTCLDRLLEGGVQARLVVVNLTDSREARHSVRGVDEAVAQLRSTLGFVLGSDEYRANFGEPPSASTPAADGSCVRVRVSFLKSLLQRTKAAASQLSSALESLGEGLPETVKAGLGGIAAELGRLVGHLEGDLQGPQAAGSEAPLRMLRELLLAMQQARQQLCTDPSLSMSGAATGDGASKSKVATDKEPAEAASAENNEEAAADAAKPDEGGADIPMPQIGVGRSTKLKGLLELLPLDRLHSSLNTHVGELPPGPCQSPLAPFVWQSLLLGRAILTGGLEAGVAAAEAAVSLLRLVCFLFEKGLGTKSEEQEDDDDEGKGQQTEWASGTGMGEGDGAKDVTDEIEDDAQLEGTKNEQQEGEKKPPDVPQEKEDTAREVGFDLDTEAQAVPQEDKAEGEPPEKRDDSNLDRERGDVDLNEGGTLDEKMWNGEDEKDDKDAKDEQTEKEKGKQEDIEAHGAKGEGDAETTAKEDGQEDGEQKKEKEKEAPDQKEEAKGEEKKSDKKPEDEEAPEEEDPVQERTKWGEEDAQFDVNMQTDGMGAQQDGNAGSDCDVDSDFVNEEGLEGEGDDDKDQGSDGESVGEDKIDGVADLDDVADRIPEQQPDEEEGEGERQDQAVEPCTEGDGAQPEQPPAPEETRPDAVQGKESKGEDQQQAEQPPNEGDAIATTSGNETSAPKPETQDRMFGGTSGASTSFETKPEESEGTGDQTSGAEQGGKASRPDAGQNSSEVPSAKPEQGGSSSQTKPSAPPEGQSSEGSMEERRLQKVDILRGADEGEKAVGEEEQAGAEQGLHLADPTSGVDALGECKDMGNAPNQALGAAEQEGEEGEAEDSAMVDEQQAGAEKEESLANMRLQEMDKDKLPEGVKLQPSEDADEEQEDAMQVDGQRGSASLTNVVVAKLPLRGAEPEAPAAPEAASSEALQRARPQRPEGELRQLWSQLERTTTPLAAALCEQLRIILEPTLKGRLQGFYRTGKRISMRRVIPFIASSYRRDKIWLRRTKPSKREYQVIVAIDNSRSMHECGVGPIALQTLSVVCQALSQLEVGEYAVLAFGSSEPRVLLPLGQGQPHTAAFGWEQARPLLAEFVFDEESADSHNRSFVDMMKLGSDMFDDRVGSGPQRPFCQMMLIISDGRFNKAKVRSWVHAALARQQLPLLIIVDSAAESGQSKPPGKPAAAGGSRRSVFDLRAVSYEGGQCNVVPYLQDFPFPYYVVVQDLQSLPNILSDVLKQWFELATAA